MYKPCSKIPAHSVWAHLKSFHCFQSVPWFFLFHPVFKKKKKTHRKKIFRCQWVYLKVGYACWQIQRFEWFTPKGPQTRRSTVGPGLQGSLQQPRPAFPTPQPLQQELTGPPRTRPAPPGLPFSALLLGGSLARNCVNARVGAELRPWTGWLRCRCPAAPGFHPHARPSPQTGGSPLTRTAEPGTHRGGEEQQRVQGVSPEQKPLEKRLKKQGSGSPSRSPPPAFPSAPHRALLPPQPQVGVHGAAAPESAAGAGPAEARSGWEPERKGT